MNVDVAAKRKRSEVDQSESTGSNTNIHFFYGSRSPFSNFYNCHFEDEHNNEFFCSEQYFMYHKAILFGDDDMAKKILEEKASPLKCKKYGRQVTPFDAQIWTKKSFSIMVNGLILKFGQNDDLREILLSTEDRLVAEASPRDRRWGIGMGETTAKKTPVDQWPGLNLLGKALMKVRSQLIRQQGEKEEQKGKNCGQKVEWE
eukprot:CAMPEP_0118688966 /NCGR_PEP_ID=MMETSP0800-20121206/9210_1 /TAXON_ID=210618 ORGANISM="Striatella unipunctata, Strain CCMP2910" /NCGR_SAMPLE_ID=MMETSP0800 /ASSEMBLY_ACC=CAM_ASM_000638 /LENGTH=201 /DNA_ID=CAMNT_0006586277 /DNA_START=146 /DNA_END=751 /DNA_ORIENTATION=-